MTTTQPKIYILHENDAWTQPLEAALTKQDLPFESWFLDEGLIDLAKTPPPGVFYNRMSASSHTRGHRYAAEYTGCVLAWLESHGAVVLNSSRALQLEVSKVAQYQALQVAGIRTPHTVAAIGRDQIMAAASEMQGAFITKHNRGGKGLGVRLFSQTESLAEYLDGSEYEAPIDGVTLVQAYIRSPQPTITRCEFVGQTFLYAVAVNTSDGFQLCPADECAIGDAFCPTNESVAPRFRIIEDFDSPLIEQYQSFLQANDIHIAGIEFIVDDNGVSHTYDINTNTNYNPDAERIAGRSAMDDIAAYLGATLLNARTSRHPSQSHGLKLAS